eukprot:Gb_28315 [translate_table: standard]
MDSISENMFSSQKLNLECAEDSFFVYKRFLLLPLGKMAAMIMHCVKNMGELNKLDVGIAIVGFMVFHSLMQRKFQGLSVWPVFGMLPSLLLHLNDVYEWFSDTVIRRGGTFTFKGPWLSSLVAVVTCDPVNIEYLLKTKFSNFPKGAYFRTVVHDLLGDGIFNADDELWRQQRKTASIEFHSLSFRNHMVQSLKELVHGRLINILEDASVKGHSIDLQDVLLRLTFDNVCMIAFGVDPGCLSVGLPEIPFAKAFEEATEATVFRFITPTVLWRAMRYLNVGMERKLRESLKGVDEFAKGVIESRMKELDGKDNSNKGADLLTIFMQLKDDNGCPYSHKFLRDICINFILAGRDTSSVALSWFFWLLHEHPHVEDRILLEINSILKRRPCFQGKKCISLSDITFTVEELKQMHYLQAAVSEALRLYPSVPVDHKEVSEDDCFPDGTRLKKGTKILYLIYAMGRMESIWGKDCREFKPERWLRDGNFVSESAYKYAAFNGGPRLCLGKDFAYFQMKWVAASIISRFHVRIVPGHPVVPKLALTMYMKHGLLVTLHPREEPSAKDKSNAVSQSTKSQGEG